MQASISKSKIEGKVTAPPSKSYTIRGLMCGALAPGQSRLLNSLGSDDTDAATSVLRKLGLKIKQNRHEWILNSNGFKAPTQDLFCGNSAATLRFMMAMCSLVPGECRLTAGLSLSARPVKPLQEALQQLGIDCTSNDGFPPVNIKGGNFKGGVVTLPGDISSQFVSALLMVAPHTSQGIDIKLSTPLESRPYVLMTLDTMQWFGITVAFNESLNSFSVLPQKYQPTRYIIESDWSSASYLLALGALTGDVTVNDLPMETMQGDRMILNFLKQMGAEFTSRGSSICVKKSNLKAIKADLTDCTDLLPTMAVLGAVAQGKTELTGIARARIKESDRVTAVSENLERMGIKTFVEPDQLVITGGVPVGAVIDSQNDHRIAMAFSLLGTAVGNTIITQANSVSKTYPEFWDVLQNLGGKVVLNEQ